MRRGPERRAALHEIAVAEDRDGHPSRVQQRQPGPDRIAGTGAQPAAAVIAEVIERLREVVGIARPAERHPGQGDFPLALDPVERPGDVARRDRRGRILGLRLDQRRRVAAGEFRPPVQLLLDDGEQLGDKRVRVREQALIAHREPEMIHRPAVMDV